jgi:uncharacterized FlgJ-related protein
METNDRLKTLCEQFSALKESEKDYILGISQALAFSSSMESKADGREMAACPPAVSPESA